MIAPPQPAGPGAWSLEPGADDYGSSRGVDRVALRGEDNGPMTGRFARLRAFGARLRVVLDLSDEAKALSAARWVFRIGLVVVGAVICYRTRLYMNPDGVSYLDVGDAVARGDLHGLVNRYWNPLYPLVLLAARALTGFSARIEFQTVHAATYVQYLLCLVGVEYFVAQLTGPDVGRPSTEGEARADEPVTPAPMVALMAYPLFFWFTASVLNLYYVTPDLLVAALVLFVAGLVARLRRGARGTRIGAVLGLLLGLAYLTKSAMLFVGGAFLVAAWLAAGLKRGVLTVAVAAAVYAVVAGSWIAVLSVDAGRLTFGDTGRLNYAWMVNGVQAFAHAGPDQGVNGRLVHPPRISGRAPRVYEFAEPVVGTYPLWTDPAYWYEGIDPPYIEERQQRVLAQSWQRYKDIARQEKLTIRMFLAALLTLLLAAGRRVYRTLWDAVRRWELALPALAPFFMYALVAVKSRYIGPFAFIIGMTLLQSVRVLRPRRAWLLAPAFSIALVLGWTLATDAMRVQEGRWNDKSWRIAEALAGRGLEPGARVGHVGYTFGAYWARLGRYRIVAEVPRGEDRAFHRTSGSRRERVIEDFRRAGAVAVIASGDTSPGAGWERLAGVDAWLLVLDPSGLRGSNGP